MIADLLMPGDERWTEALRMLPHDVYHIPAYTVFCARQEGGRPAALYARHDDAIVLAPVVVRALPAELDLPCTWCDATSPYGYASPLVTETTDSASVEALFAAFRPLALQHEMVAGFFRLHPLLPLPTTLLERWGALVRHGQTVVVNLRCSGDELGSGFRDGHRYDIRKLRKMGFTVEIGSWERLPEFVEVYRETMRRVSADEQYMFTREYFDGLRTALGETGRLAVCLTSDGTLAAASLFSEHDGIVQYLFSGAAGAHLRQAPTKLLLDRVIAWAHQRGNRVLHLGGGLGGRQDSLFDFKAGFSSGRADFMTWRVIWDDDRVARSNTRWSERMGGSAGPQGFFPPYRA